MTWATAACLAVAVFLAPQASGQDAQGMQHDAQMQGMEHTMGMGSPAMAPAMAPPMAPATTRTGDWSDGVAPMSMHDMHAMDMDDASSTGTVLLDQLESWSGHDSHGQSWEAEGWYGNDRDKLWVRSEGHREGKLRDGDVEALWSHAVATFWDAQVGLRSDIGDGRHRQWAAFGLQGLAPYWFDVEATAYAGQGGHTAARVRVEYDVLFTQRLILQPEIEVNAYGKNDPSRGIRSGVSSIDGGLRLRYDIRRAIAPYVGIAWEHLAGGTADLAASRGRRVTDRRWVAGVRLQF